MQARNRPSASLYGRYSFLPGVTSTHDATTSTRGQSSETRHDLFRWDFGVLQAEGASPSFLHLGLTITGAYGEPGAWRP